MGPEHVRSRPRSGLELLFDRGGLHDSLPERGSPRPPDRKKVREVTVQFLRCLGLLVVGVGRGEVLTAVTGCGILRNQLISLLLETAHVEDRGGALRLNPLLSAEQREVLEGLPSTVATLESVLEVHRALARAFLPLARRLHAELGLEWPERFEEATLAYVEREIGMDLRAQ